MNHSSCKPDLARNCLYTSARTLYPVPRTQLLITLTEQPAPGPVPRFEIPDWRERLGVVAGVTGRGSKERPFDLGLWTGEPVGQVMTRWRDLRGAEPGFGAHVVGTQIHQTAVAWQDEVPAGWTLLDGVDGHATGTAGVMLYVTIADCIPVYLIDPVHRAVALLHAGWRGTASGILGRAITLFVNQVGSSPEELLIHCGVGICGPCYEVGSEVRVSLGLEAPGSGPWPTDLRATLVAQARQLGITHISTSQWCSAHDNKLFFSHRASRGVDGRMVAYLGIRE